MKKINLLAVVSILLFSISSQAITLDELNEGFAKASKIDSQILGKKILDKVWVSTFSFSSVDPEARWEYSDAVLAIQSLNLRSPWTQGAANVFKVSRKHVQNVIRNPIYGDSETSNQIYTSKWSSANFMMKRGVVTVSNIEGGLTRDFTGPQWHTFIFLDALYIFDECKYINESDRIICMSKNEYETTVQVFQHF